MPRRGLGVLKRSFFRPPYQPQYLALDLSRTRRSIFRWRVFHDFYQRLAPMPPDALLEPGRFVAGLPDTMLSLVEYSVPAEAIAEDSHNMVLHTPLDTGLSYPIAVKVSKPMARALARGTQTASMMLVFITETMRGVPRLELWLREPLMSSEKGRVRALAKLVNYYQPARVSLEEGRPQDREDCMILALGPHGGPYFTIRRCTSGRLRKPIFLLREW